jgi:hypothetical protein
MYIKLRYFEKKKKENKQDVERIIRNIPQIQSAFKFIAKVIFTSYIDTDVDGTRYYV